MTALTGSPEAIVFCRNPPDDFRRHICFFEIKGPPVCDTPSEAPEGPLGGPVRVGVMTPVISSKLLCVAALKEATPPTL